MTKGTNIRYTDSELINILQKLAIDYGIKPSQRIITGDATAPTHHTYINRFGSVPEALKVAGLFTMTDSTLFHKMLKDILQSHDLELKEYVSIGDFKVDFLVNDKYAIDILALFGVDDDIGRRHGGYRENVVEMTNNYEYNAIFGIDDMKTVIGEIMMKEGI